MAAKKKANAALPKAACYHRISVEADESTSIEAQMELTHRWCELNGFHPKDYTDAGISGSGKVTRPAWDSMLADIQAGKMSVVVVKDMSRLARNIRQTLDLSDIARIVTVDGGVDTETATGKLLMSLLSTFASFEREQSVIRQRVSQQYRRRHGRAVGSIPYGFSNEQTPDGAYRRIDPTEAAVIKRVVDNLIAGSSLRSQADMLNSEGTLTRKGNKWSAASLSQMVTNPSIIGLTPMNDHVLTDEDGVPIQDKKLAIISLAKWKKMEAAQDKRAKYRNRGNHYDRLMLSGLVYCGACGRRCTRATTTVKGKKYANYSCTADARTLCDARGHISANKLEPFVIEKLMEWGEGQPVVKAGSGDNTDHVGVERRNLIRLEIDAAAEALRTASASDIEVIAKRITGLRELHDEIPVTLELANFEYEDYDVAEWARRDPEAAARNEIQKILISPAGGNTRAPVEDRVEIIFKVDVFG